MSTPQKVAGRGLLRKELRAWSKASNNRRIALLILCVLPLATLLATFLIGLNRGGLYVLAGNLLFIFCGSFTVGAPIAAFLSARSWSHASLLRRTKTFTAIAVAPFLLLALINGAISVERITAIQIPSYFHGLSTVDVEVVPRAVTTTTIYVPPPWTNSATAECADGTLSYSANHRGTCSHHGGVAIWFR